MISHRNRGHIQHIGTDVSNATFGKGEDGFVEFGDHDGHFVEFVEVLGVLDKLLETQAA